MHIPSQNQHFSFNTFAKIRLSFKKFNTLPKIHFSPNTTQIFKKRALSMCLSPVSHLAAYLQYLSFLTHIFKSGKMSNGTTSCRSQFGHAGVSLIFIQFTPFSIRIKENQLNILYANFQNPTYKTHAFTQHSFFL